MFMFSTNLINEILYSIDQVLELIYLYVEIPLQNTFYYFGNRSLCSYRRRRLLDFGTNWMQRLVQSYIITFFLYFFLLFFAQLFSTAIERYHFIDPLISTNRQCVNIQFVKIYDGYEFKNSRLRENFIKENSIIGNESHRIETFNYEQFHQLLNLLQNSHYVICQRSLYIYTRFHVYSSLLHSTHSQFRFFIPKYLSSFSIDRPPFLDLCVHASNESHLADIKSRLRPLSSSYYSSVNLFLFDFGFTQVSVTLYELDKNSKHLERVSIHTGWLRNLYSQFYFFKYDYALSTVLFDGLSTGQHFIEYFNYKDIPVPADPLLGLNEMVQQALLVLPLCHSTLDN